MSILSVTNTIQQPSLIPYLQSGSGRFCLMISLEPASELSPLEPCQNPFQFRAVSDPFTLLGNACIVSDIGEQLLPLYMLVQRSDYNCSPEDRHLSTNLSIDQRWQHIMSGSSFAPLNNRHFLLAEQIGAQGQLLQFRSLFYCRTKQSFFHPACPDCGKELVLCTDDPLLCLRGLEEYTTSLRRFLYCSQCSSDILTGNYYVFRRTENDPECVSDIQQLIRNWAQLQPATAPDTPLPCPSCPGYRACYGRDILAVNTLCSFSFYPFYMLLLKAESNMNFDFLALLSDKEEPQEDFVQKDRQTEPESLLKPIELNIPEPTSKRDIPNAAASADAAIRAILEDITARWENEEEEKKQPPLTRKINQSSSIPVSKARGPSDFMETVILNSTSMSHNRAQPADRQGNSGVEHKNEKFGPNREAHPSSQFNPADTIQRKQAIPEDQKTNKKSFDHPIKNRREEQLRETIIIPQHPGQQIRSHLKPSLLSEDTGQKTTNNRHTPAANEKQIDVDLAETLLQRPGKKP
jgi:hypothetical protein